MRARSKRPARSPVRSLETKSIEKSPRDTRKRQAVSLSLAILVKRAGTSAASTRRPGAIRLIEVKGKGRPWDDDEVVELSRAQIRKAFETTNEQTTNSWYLYVREKTNNGGHQVGPRCRQVDTRR